MSLVVQLRLADGERTRTLRRWLEAAGHGLTDSPADADVVLTDRPGGVDETTAPVVVLGEEPDADVAGVLPRDASPAQIDAGLRAAAAGLTVRPARPAGFAAAASPTLLTPREVDILTAIGGGASNKAAARALGISAHTVKFHLEAVFAKLGASSRAEAVAKGLRRRLIEL